MAIDAVNGVIIILKPQARDPLLSSAGFRLLIESANRPEMESRGVRRSGAVEARRMQSTLHDRHAIMGIGRHQTWETKLSDILRSCITVASIFLSLESRNSPCLISMHVQPAEPTTSSGDVGRTNSPSPSWLPVRGTAEPCYARPTKSAKADIWMMS